MGTQLMLAGLEQGNCGEAWNLTHPEKVLAIQRRYAEAGSDCILTNTFGGSRIMLNRHSQAGTWWRSIRPPCGSRARPSAAARLRDRRYRTVRRPDGAVRRFHREQVRDAFNEQAKRPGGRRRRRHHHRDADLARRAAAGHPRGREAGAPCIIGSMAYDVTLDGSTFRTMMGIDPERAAEFMQENGADIVALNCGTGMDMERARTAVERYRKVTGLPVMVQPNAGQPKLVNMKVVYDETPEQMVPASRRCSRPAPTSSAPAAAARRRISARSARRWTNTFWKGKIHENQAV
jgi:5-methyltetrahydrofolate--homocysteine methyltransferase